MSYPAGIQLDHPPTDNENLHGRSSAPRHVAIIDPLRGIAAFAVCMFHLASGEGAALGAGSPLSVASSYGWLGVEVFMVISGFVTAYSMCRSDYRWDRFGQYTARRLKRLVPPYYAAIVLVAVVQLLSSQTPGFRGVAWPWTWQQVAAQALFLNSILGLPWMNVAFWYLAIELQFCLLMALVFPAVFRGESTLVAAVAPISLAALGFLGRGNESYLLHWLPIFAVGLSACTIVLGRVRPLPGFLSLMLLAFIVAAVNGVPYAATSVLTAGAIMAWRYRSIAVWMVPFARLGAISYSLYLVHVPIGNSVLRVWRHWPVEWQLPQVAALTAVAVSVAFAYVFWLAIERPSSAWAASSNRRAELIGRESVPSPEAVA